MPYVSMVCGASLLHLLSNFKLCTLEYRINGGVGIIGGLEMVRYGNNRGGGGWNNRGGGAWRNRK